MEKNMHKDTLQRFFFFACRHIRRQQENAIKERIMTRLLLHSEALHTDSCFWICVPSTFWVLNPLFLPNWPQKPYFMVWNKQILSKKIIKVQVLKINMGNKLSLDLKSTVFIVKIHLIEITNKIFHQNLHCALGK